MNEVTGRMGTRQYLVRSIAAMREQVGVPLPGGQTLVPELAQRTLKQGARRA